MAAESIRNLTFLGQSDAGKTSLVEALALWAGATNRLGKVEEGTTLCDFTQEEKEKKHSLAGAVVHIKTKGGEINLIDTPGYPDFQADALTSLGAAGTAVLTVAARMEGIPFHAKRLWELAGKAGCARAVVLTRLDGDNLELDGVIKGLREALGDQVLPLYLANGTGASFTEVARVGDDNLYRGAMVDAIVEADDALMESYLDTGEVSEEDLTKALPQAIAKGTFSPLFCIDPIRNIGVKEFGEFFNSCFPVSSDLFEVVKGETAEGGGADDRVVARAWKVLTDKHLGQITYLRVLQGTLKSDSTLNGRDGKSMKVNGLSTILGKDLSPIDSAGPGAIVAVSRMEDVHVGDELVSEGDAQVYDFHLPEPFASLAVRPKTRDDEQKIGAELTKLAKEDPTFRMRRDPVTHETICDGLSDLHLQTNLRRMDGRGVGFETDLPRIAYQETITGSSKGHHRHKKQTGGRGQFAECYIRLVPNDRGAGFEFINKVVGGSIPRNFIPAVEKGMIEIMNQGIIAGNPVVDLKAELYDGKFHDVDSDELSFKLAGGRALREAFMSANPILLEPVMEATISVPSRYFGDVTGDLNTRRGQVLGMESEGDFQVVRAFVPLAEVQTYVTALRSMSHGEGMFTMKFDHYDQVPAHLQAQVVEARSKALQEA